MFIVGRGLAGMGSGAIVGGLGVILRYSFPLPRQALMIALAGGCQSIGLVAAPLIGGVLIDAWTWRLCFGINLPLGVLCIAFSAYGFSSPAPELRRSRSLKERFWSTDPLGTLLAVPALTCLLLALQWGGTKYGWNDSRIIILFVLFTILIAAFGYIQYRQGDNATVPPRVVGQRSILGGMWFSVCTNGILATTEYYIAIYFQGVRGYSATKSGLLGIPMIVGLAAASLLGGAGTTRTGYYFRKLPEQWNSKKPSLT